MQPFWADFRTPPINLWVMPAFVAAQPVARQRKTETPTGAQQHRQRQQLMLRLLATRGG